MATSLQSIPTYFTGATKGEAVRNRFASLEVWVGTPGKFQREDLAQESHLHLDPVLFASPTHNQRGDVKLQLLQACRTLVPVFPGNRA
ncbi:hypothetical protein DSO57_1013698 [Entomophthora muscae]|uniref:Uncharacterized protein n=1 Tax=Entomophthora muscae TaxID=34485 RepID=A0ACC2TGH4_9FUNG|nr:hypothetical protein DSO57_1013698 [Entomophthora muscae]